MNRPAPNRPDERPGDALRRWADQVDRSADVVARVMLLLIIGAMLTELSIAVTNLIIRFDLDEWFIVYGLTPKAMRVWSSSLLAAALALLALAGVLLLTAAVARRVADRRDARQEERS